MTKMLAAISIGGEVLCSFASQDEADIFMEDQLNKLMFEIREIEVNDGPPSGDVEEAKQELLDYCHAKGIQHMHLSRGPEFYAMDEYERYKYILEIFRETENATPVTSIDGHLKKTRFDDSFDFDEEFEEN